MSPISRTRRAVSLPSASAARSMLLDLAPALDRRLGVLAARLVPAHREPVLAGQRHAQQLLGVHVQLRAEAAADGRRDDAHLVLGDAQRDRRHDLEDVRDLRRRVERDVAAERLGHGDDRPRLHRHRDQPLLDVALAHRVGGSGEGGVDGAVLRLDLQGPGVAGVGAEVLVDDRRGRRGRPPGRRRPGAARRSRRWPRWHRAPPSRWRRAPRPRRRRRSAPSRRPAGSAAGSSCPR